MKNLNWILHSISILSILFLFIQNRSLQNSTSKTLEKSTAQTANSSLAPIAFFDSDSLLSQLGFFKKSEEEFKKKQEKMSNELKAKEANFQKEIQALQSKAQNLTRNELEAGQGRLAKMEQDLMEKKESLSQELAEETSDFNEKLHQKLTSYLKEMNSNRKYSYVFSVARGGNIYYSDETYDITNELAKALNEKYSK